MKKNNALKSRVRGNKHKMIKIISPIRKVGNKYVYWN
jgi:hypothetical protein